MMPLLPVPLIGLSFASLLLYGRYWVPDIATLDAGQTLTCGGHKRTNGDHFFVELLDVHA
jgi:hypothetical protein